MRFFLTKAFLSVALACLGSSVASADVLFRNTGTGITDPLNPALFGGDLFGASTAHNVAVVEDGTFAVSGGPFVITGIKVGYDNQLANPLPVDLLVQFYDTATYTGSGSLPIPSSPIGPQFRLPVVAVAGAGETGILPIAGVIVPDNTFAVVTRLVDTATTNDNQNILFLYKDMPVDVGSSNPLFGADLDHNGTILRSETLTWEGGGFPAANLYLEVDGVVPEPTSAALLSATALSMARWSRGRRVGRSCTPVS